MAYDYCFISHYYACIVFGGGNVYLLAGVAVSRGNGGDQYPTCSLLFKEPGVNREQNEAWAGIGEADEAKDHRIVHRPPSYCCVHRSYA